MSASMRPAWDRSNRQFLPGADFIHVPGALHFIAMEGPDEPAKDLKDAQRHASLGELRSDVASRGFLPPPQTPKDPTCSTFDRSSLRPGALKPEAFA
jgi:hypothetical protein